MFKANNFNGRKWEQKQNWVKFYPQKLVFLGIFFRIFINNYLASCLNGFVFRVLHRFKIKSPEGSEWTGVEENQQPLIMGSGSWSLVLVSHVSSCPNNVLFTSSFVGDIMQKWFFVFKYLWLWIYESYSMLVRAKYVRCPGGIADGLRGKPSGH